MRLSGALAQTGDWQMGGRLVCPTLVICLERRSQWQDRVTQELEVEARLLGHPVPRSGGHLQRGNIQLRRVSG